MVLLASKKIPMGTPMPDFPALQATDGKSYAAADLKKPEMLVVVFMCFHCPYVKAIVSDLLELENAYYADEVQFVLINPNDEIGYPDASLEKMKSHAANYGFEHSLILKDADQTVARDFDAVCTPDIFLYDKDRKLIYHGQIEEIDEAIEGYFANNAPLPDQIPSQGCSIKWK